MDVVAPTSQRKVVSYYRLAHAATLTSGLLPVQYERFGDSWIGHIEFKTLDGIVDGISQVSEVLADHSFRKALQCEIFENSLNDINPRIDIMTDARHGWERIRRTRMWCVSA